MLLPSLILLLQETVTSTVPAETVRGTPATVAAESDAFPDSATRALFQLARRARETQDSTLRGYDAKTQSRITVKLGTSMLKRNGLLFRIENVAKVQWRRGQGMWIEPLAHRTTVPMEESGYFYGVAASLIPVPYFPGREQLWMPGSDQGIVRTEVAVDGVDGFLHPLARGSEAFYRYRLGDSLRIRLPSGDGITLRELKVLARKPEWRRFVGSFWIDTRSGALVRAAYRLSAPLEVWNEVLADAQRSVTDTNRSATPEWKQRVTDGNPLDKADAPPALIRAIVNPLRFDISLVTVEYALYEGKFWLPRVNRAEGLSQAMFMRIPITVEESYQYDDVDGTAPLPPLPADTTAQGIAAREPAQRRTIRAERRKARIAECTASGGTYTRIETRNEGALRYGVRLPCDSTALATSTELPTSPYDPNEAVFSQRDADALASSLGLGLQASFGPQPLRYDFGITQQRYNRIEGFSIGGEVQWPLGAGYTASGAARIGVADWQPNAEVRLARSNGRTTVQGALFRRLSYTNDFGNPLSVGSSLATLLYGRDEGFYYRTLGGELTWAKQRTNGQLTWRAFGERHDDARKRWNFNVANAFSGDREMLDNIVAQGGTIGGGAMQWQSTYGLDPRGWQVATDMRAEAAGGSFNYARGLSEVTVSRPLFWKLSFGQTASAGIASDHVPLQRQFYMGGLRTVRGQIAGSRIGDSYWLSRSELGYGSSAARRTLFLDLGWAGRRAEFSNPGRPLAGYGFGASFIDGLIRTDISRGIFPRKGMRFDISLGARF